MDANTSTATEKARDVTAPPQSAAEVERPTGKREHVQLKLKRIPLDKWDALVATFDGVCQEMTAVFAKRRWPKVDLEPVVMLNKGEAVAGALVMIQRLPLGLAKLAIVKWGPALRNETGGQCQAIYAQAIDLLVEEYAEKRGMMLSVMARAPRRKGAECVEFLAWRGFRRGSGLLFPERYMVKLRYDDKVLRAGLLQKWRYHLGKSEKEDLVFEHAAPDRLPEFDRLYQAMADRKKFPDYSAYDTLPDLLASTSEALRPELFFVTKDGQLLAGAVIFTAGRTAVYLYGATADEALPLRAGYFMHWQIMRWLRDNTGADLYDLGGTDGFQGLRQFKKGMVGSTGIIAPVPPIYNFASNPLALFVGTAAYAARDAVQQTKRFINWMRTDMARPNQER
ncbi:MAG: GNAT family N-acetyltransferase [Alphaproteobacteria bacterium]|nr:GNAT family N-acetyltransferase [Alphaproteobacteria bacterium]